MSLNSIEFNRNKSGLGAPLLNDDHISGLIFYNANKPTAFGDDDIKKVFSLEQIEDLGITKENSFPVIWYHVSEFFEKQPSGELYVGIFDEPGATPDFAEVVTMQEFSNGDIRQIGVLLSDTITDDTNMVVRVTAIQSQVDICKGNDMPLNVIFAPDIFGVELTALPDLRTGTSNNVSVTIGQDGGAFGAELFTTNSKSTTDLGAKLGAVSRAKVNESISYIEKFAMVTASSEFDNAAFSNGDFVRNTPKAQVNALDNLGYIFLIKEIGYAGTFNNDSYTATAENDDLWTIERNRTIDKAVRRTRQLLVPKLGSPIFVNPDGTLTLDTIATFKGLSDQGLAQMEADGELSASATIINPSQNVIATSKLIISLELVPVGVARSIIVNVGFVPNISA
jgi:hypothetical protein